MNLQTDRSGRREIEVEEVHSPINKIISTKPNETDESPESGNEEKPVYLEEPSLTMLNLAATQEATQEGISSENRSAALSVQL